MRLWHYQLIPFLPDNQLLAQWRELNSIFKNQPNHILINYVYEYNKGYLSYYTSLIIKELLKRQFKITNKCYKQVDDYFKDCTMSIEVYKNIINPFKNHHTDRYLLQCFYNLQEKYDRGQKDFTEERYKKLEKYVYHRLYDMNNIDTELRRSVDR